MTAPRPTTPAGDSMLLALAARLRWGPTDAGLLSGSDRGARLGRAGEFEEFRPWRPGEDLRALDASVYRRLRRRVARVDREDSALPLTLLIDRSASMADRARRRWTREIAIFLLALARHRGEPARVLLLESGGVRAIAPATPATISEALESAEPRGALSLPDTLRSIAAAPGGPGRVVLLSDGFGIEDERALAPLDRHGRTIWLAPWLREEVEPTPGGTVRLLSREGERAWEGILDRATIDRYCAHHRAWWNRMVSALRAHGGVAERCIADDGALATIEAALTHGRWLRR